MKKAFLVLQDGTVFEGCGFGANCLKSGEVVFNTALSGYQEILTDPSYHEQIVVMTYPHIGNTGVNPVDVESKQVYAAGFVIRDLSSVVSNYRAKQSLDEYLKESKVPGIAEIDTRALVRHLREKGAMPAVLAVGSKHTVAELKKKAKALPSMTGKNLAKVVSSKKSYSFKKGVPNVVKGELTMTPASASAKATGGRGKYKVVAYDFGVKQNILRLLVDAGCEVQVVPYDYPAEKILKSKTKIDGVFLSNGPGDPAPCEEAIQNVKTLLGHKPLFGICLGHQILSLAVDMQ